MVHATAVRLLLISALLLALLEPALAVPPAAAEYHGTVRIDGKDAPVGTNISIIDSDERLCGSALTSGQGRFGLVSCRGDDLSTPADEGARRGEQVTLLVDGLQVQKAVWKSGSISEVDLYSVTPRFEASFPGAFLLPVFPLTIFAVFYVYLRRFD